MTGESEEVVARQDRVEQHQEQASPGTQSCLGLGAVRKNPERAAGVCLRERQL